MYCPNCGMPASSESIFCSRCGTRLPNPAPTVRESAPEEEPQAVTPAPEEPETPAQPPAAEVPAAEPEKTTPAEPEDEEESSAEPEAGEESPAEPLEAENASPVITPISEPAPKKGRLWPPIVCLCALFFVGLVAFLTLPSPSPAEDEPSAVPTLPEIQSPAKPFQQAQSTPWFSVIGGTLYFDSSLYTGGSDLVVPMYVDGALVTAISARCFQDCTELTSVSLPSTLISIGSRAFAGCTSLRGINILDGIFEIGDHAFSGCTALEAVHLPGSLDDMGKGVFEDCTYLRFIFFDGTHAQWEDLYNEFITPFTAVSCTDGIFYHGVSQP